MKIPDASHLFSPLSPELLKAVQDAAQIVLAGGVVAYPSETVWGLAAHPQQGKALQRLYALKGRAADKPVQVSCLSLTAALQYAESSAELSALSVMWPGPLTVVTAARAACPAALAPQGQVGLRVPDHPVALALLQFTGGLLATTSCNRSGEPPARTHAQAAALGLGDLVLPDAAASLGAQGVASTVVQLPGGVILREGAVSAAHIHALLHRAGRP